MEYHILSNGEIIASFEHESDRDRCAEILADIYFDCKFTIQDDE